MSSEKVFQVLNNIPGSQLLSDVQTLFTHYFENIFFQGLFKDFRWLPHFWRVVPLRCTAQCQDKNLCSQLASGQWRQKTYEGGQNAGAAGPATYC